ncbi:MAG: glycosyl hydrolase 53 family protein [Candidatus Heimdallarchaeota archaeon]|nr:glycosyl hydrolase 53 family protein [Candidatus Heimdallarchaeota archaeon]
MRILFLTLLLLLSQISVSADLEIAFLPYRGIDASSLLLVEEHNGKFFNGEEVDVLDHLYTNGFNYLRIRVFNDPDDGYYNQDYLLQLAKRASSLGFSIYLDFHYSDSWADPGQQAKPHAWENHSIEELQSAVYNFTSDTVAMLLEEEVDIGMVQVGNEITCGILFPEGDVCVEDNWNNLASLLSAGIQAVRDQSNAYGVDHPQIMLHTDTPSSWFYTHLLQEEMTEFDIIGTSYYPAFHGSMEQLQQGLDWIMTNTDYDLMIAETNYPFTLGWNDDVHNLYGLEEQLHEGYPATPEGQHQFFADLVNVVASLPDDRGKGIAYWEPAWISSDIGSSLENVAFYDFEGEALPIASIFSSFAPISSTTSMTSPSILPSSSSSTQSSTPIFQWYILILMPILIKTLKRSPNIQF